MRFSSKKRASGGFLRPFSPILWKKGRGYELLLQHDLSAGDGDGLTGLVLLLDEVEDRDGDVADAAAAVHRHLRLVVALDVLDGLRAGHLAGAQVLDEQPALGVAPQRPVEEVAGADRVDLDVVGAELQREALDEADAAGSNSCSRFITREAYFAPRKNAV